MVETGDFSVEAGPRGARTLLTREATAVFCFSDEMAIGALEAVRERSLSCLADVSVAGFDDIHFARYLTPPLTTIAQPRDPAPRSRAASQGGRRRTAGAGNRDLAA